MADDRRIALLRGINLGSTRRVAMADLRDLLTGLGLADVRTLLQSGNAVFTSAKQPATLERDIERAIADRLGLEVPIVVRTRDELAAVVDLDPLGGVADEPKLYQGTFLSGAPDPEGVAALEALDAAPERVEVHGREVYAWHAGGIQRSKLARLIGDKQLGVTCTARNWNTVTKLLELADG